MAPRAGDRALGSPHFMQMRKALMRLEACEAPQIWACLGPWRREKQREGQSLRTFSLLFSQVLDSDGSSAA